MGLFDSVFHPCDCGASVRVEWQTKALPNPYLNTLPMDAVPVAAAHDLNGEVAQCDQCGKAWRLEALAPVPDTVPMRAVPA